MNVNVTVSVFEAPGLDFKRKNELNAAIQYFQGANSKITVDPTQTIGAADLYTKAIASASDTIKAALIFLRVKVNGKLVNLTKTFNEEKITTNAFIKIEVLFN